MSDAERISQRIARPVSYPAITALSSGVTNGAAKCPVGPGSGAPTACSLSMSHSRSATSSLS
jgi:hypothetical protein